MLSEYIGIIATMDSCVIVLKDMTLIMKGLIRILEKCYMVGLGPICQTKILVVKGTRSQRSKDQNLEGTLTPRIRGQH